MYKTSLSVYQSSAYSTLFQVNNLAHEIDYYLHTINALLDLKL